jgi:hypothetical protein
MRDIAQKTIEANKAALDLQPYLNQIREQAEGGGMEIHFQTSSLAPGEKDMLLKSLREKGFHCSITWMGKILVQWG